MRSITYAAQELSLAFDALEATVCIPVSALSHVSSKSMPCNSCTGIVRIVCILEDFEAVDLMDFPWVLDDFR